ncbi:N-acetylglucosamine-6-phosphate deacetylase [Demequina sp. B12]|uniref:N-acetylglucosamine-6-phosphate deacetylase n=1 Tax=Demequina sp. B12 TaxID=2992757 RepID=UPI00237B6322|nr:N-acetylglucosamine-6-phosphate deacetylase [Demequina sp. B12]MDE0572534.1 N-acetylglucosamine-6-phosphate deacetylase [Demequina sp. B12]
MALLTDIHGHGGGGHSFGDSVDSTLAAAAAHRATGTHAMVASLVSLPIADTITAMDTVRQAMAQDESILGVHLEGPFLALERKGAHKPANLIDPSPAVVSELLEAADGIIKQITMDPAREGALDAIERFVEAGVIVAVGHTEATAALSREAFDRGASLLTHGFNAMKGIVGREIGPVGAAMDDERVYIELIADGIHVDPALIASMFRAAPGRVVLVTDAMAAAAAPEGAYMLGELEVDVKDGKATLKGTDTIAGSTLTMTRAIEVCVEAGVPEADAVAAASTVPRALLGLD